MTQEQFNKVCEIVREIDSLECAKEKICSFPYGQDIGLRFCQREYKGIGWNVINIDALAFILAKHEELIRQDIDNRINELKKQIEEI